MGDNTVAASSTIVVGVCSVELHIPAAHSLKDKRQVIRSVVTRLRQRFNVSVAEVGSHDIWQSAELAIVCVSNDRGYAHGLLSKAIQTLESSRLDLLVVDYRIEFW